MVSWILAGHPEHDILQAIAHTFPDATPETLLRDAANHFLAAGQSDATALRGFCIEAYREIYKRALDIGDYTTSLKALSRLEATAAKA